MGNLRDNLIGQMRREFGADQRRIDHALRVLGYAEQILDGGHIADRDIVVAAAILHDIGIQAAERKHGSSAGKWQELEGPPIARPMLAQAGLSPAAADHVCRIIANHHSARDIDTPEFRAVWDADWLVNLPDVHPGAERSARGDVIARTFKTDDGRQLARDIYLKQEGATMTMFCYQCEQTAGGKACTTMGVCGKDATTAALQDLLVHAVQGISMYAHRARPLGVQDSETDVFAIEALFATLTNVNFDPARLRAMILQAAKLRDRMKAAYEAACRKGGKTPETLAGPAAWQPASDLNGLVAQGAAITIAKRLQQQGADLTGLQELLMYGLKGAAAYADHAQILGHEDEAVYAWFHENLAWLAEAKPDVNALVGRALKCGEMNLSIMGLLDRAHTGAYGDPTPTPVRITPVKGKAILVSGHDLKDLEELLKQTAGKGINVYTHGEMLPAHGYPKLKQYKHLVGNYGGAWQDQRTEFDAFPGAILMTTNCLMRPKDTYRDGLFTSGVVAWPNVRHIANRDFAPVIAAAQAAPGFTEDGPAKTILTGFGYAAVMSVAPAVIDAVKAGTVRHFFLIGGCDGARPGRNYYTEFAEAVPKDCVILTLACGKYRFNKLDFGDIGGIPRLLDVGQCNDAYSAIQIAVALAKAFHTDVNGLPLSLVLSWFEQKAVVILLTLLHLGIKNIRLGPTLPAFLTPAVLNVLVDKFNIQPITTPLQDLKAILG